MLLHDKAQTAFLVYRVKNLKKPNCKILLHPVSLEIMNCSFVSIASVVKSRKRAYNISFNPRSLSFTATKCQVLFRWQLSI